MTIYISSPPAVKNDCPTIQQQKIPLVSVIIPTFNNQSTIEMCICSIKEQTYRNFEIILVDNHSTDQTSIIARKLGTILISESCGMAKARNIGASAAKGEYLLHIDSDMKLNQQVVEECVKLCLDGANSVIIPEISIGDSYLAKCRALEKELIRNAPGYESARFFEKGLFNQIGGYDERLEAGEDYDIHYRFEANGFLVGRAKSVINHYEGHLSLKTIIKKGYKYGRTVGKFSVKHKNRLRNQPSVPKIFLKNGRLVAKSYKLLPGLITMQMINFILMGLRSRMAQSFKSSKTVETMK